MISMSAVGYELQKFVLENLATVNYSYQFQMPVSLACLLLLYMKRLFLGSQMSSLFVNSHVDIPIIPELSQENEPERIEDQVAIAPQ